MIKRYLGILVGAAMVLAAAEAQAASVTFSTTGVFSVSGTNVAVFNGVNGDTTLTFNGTTDVVNTPAGAQFGDLVVSTTVPPGADGPTVSGNFTLNFNQVSPAGTGSLLGTLSGTLGFNTGIATLAFTTTTITIGGFTYVVNPSYTIALPVTGVGGGANTGTTTIQGTVVGGAVPDNGSTLMLLGGALLGLALVQRRFRSV